MFGTVDLHSRVIQNDLRIRKGSREIKRVFHLRIVDLQIKRQAEFAQEREAASPIGFATDTRPVAGRRAPSTRAAGRTPSMLALRSDSRQEVQAGLRYMFDGTRALPSSINGHDVGRKRSLEGDATCAFSIFLGH